MGRVFAIALLLAIAMVADGCNSTASSTILDPPDSARYEAPRVTAEIPDGWHTTEEPLSGLIEPRPLLSAASFDLRGARSRANCTPVRALEMMPSDGALIVVLAYGDDDLSARARRDLPRRPEHLRLGPASFGHYECSGRSYDLQFRERDRGYKINVWLDPSRVNPEIRRQAVELLNGLELRPNPDIRKRTIRSFDADLVSPTALRVAYRLSEPADLALMIEGARPGSPSGAIPFDASGNHPDPALAASTSPPGRGEARVHFERGEFNFADSPRLRFYLRADTDDLPPTYSETVTLNRDGLFGRDSVKDAIRALGDREP